MTKDSVSGTFNKNTWNLEKVLTEVGRYGVSPLFSMHVAYDSKEFLKQKITVGMQNLIINSLNYIVISLHQD